MMQWVIYDGNGKQIGTFAAEDADDEDDAVQSWSDQWLSARLEDVKK